MNLIQVKEIGHKGMSVMVEYVLDGKTYRKVLSYRNIREGLAELKDLENAAPYGVDVASLAEHLNLADFPTRLEQACRSRNLWNKSDFTSNPTLVMASLQEALHFDTTTLLNLILSSDD